MNKQSETEKFLLKELNKIGLYPKTQYKIDRLTVDFAFLELKVVVEIDGIYHRTREQKEADGNRDDFLQSIGWKVRRFTAEETFENTSKIAYKIKVFLDKFQKAQSEKVVPAIPRRSSNLPKYDWRNRKRSRFRSTRRWKHFNHPKPVQPSRKPLRFESAPIPRPQHSSLLKPALAFILIVLALYFISAKFKDGSENLPGKISELDSNHAFDQSAINTNVPGGVSTSLEVTAFCEQKCEESGIAEANERTGASIIKCYCKGKEFTHFDSRTHDEISSAEAFNRNSYLNLYWQNYKGPDPYYEIFFNNLTIGMNPQEFHRTTHLASFWRDSKNNETEFEVYKNVPDEDRIRVYFDKAAFEYRKISESITQQVPTDARIIKVELYYSGEKIKEK